MAGRLDTYTLTAMTEEDQRSQRERMLDGDSTTHKTTSSKS